MTSICSSSFDLCGNFIPYNYVLFYVVHKFALLRLVDVMFLCLVLTFPTGTLRGVD